MWHKPAYISKNSSRINCLKIITAKKVNMTTLYGITKGEPKSDCPQT